MEKFIDDLCDGTEVDSNVVKFQRRSISEIEHRQQNLDLVRKSVVERMMEIETLRESYEKGLKDLEEKELDFCAVKEGERWKLALKEDELSVKREELLNDARMMEEKMNEQLVCLREKINLLEVGQQSMHQRVGEKLKEIEIQEQRLDSAWDSLSERERKSNRIVRKINRWLETKSSELERKEESLISKETKLEEKLMELELKQVDVDSALELNQRRLEELERKEKSLNSVKKFTGDCFKEHIAIKKQLLLEKDLIKRLEKDLDFNESVDIKFILRMDGRTLQMFLNDPKKDLESMGDEIFQVLHLSCDPAKLVLDAMVGFYPPHLRKGDVEIDVRRTCIILLEQLSKMTKIIQPSTRKEAIELASSWKSKMGASGEDPLEVLGFLHPLAAYNLTSYFDKHEILGFLKIINQLRQCPLQFGDFGFEDIFTDSTVEIGGHQLRKRQRHDS